MVDDPSPQSGVYGCQSEARQDAARVQVKGALRGGYPSEARVPVRDAGARQERVSAAPSRVVQVPEYQISAQEPRLAPATRTALSLKSPESLTIRDVM